MKKLFILISGLIFALSAFSQGRDFTFCYGSISVTIFDGGRAEMVRYNQSGVVIKTLSGEFNLYGIGNPTELLKITFSGSSEEYRYDLIRDGKGTPSLIIDGQGRKYGLCKTGISKTNTKSLDEMMKEAEEKRKKDKLVSENTAKELSAEMKRIYSNVNNSQLRKNVPEQFQKVKDECLVSIMELFSEQDKALYAKLDNESEKIIKENLEKTGDKYGDETNSSLIAYLINSTDTKMELPNECKIYIYETSDYDYHVVRQIKNGYVKNSILYTSEGLSVGKIKQNESTYYIDFIDSNDNNLRINIFKNSELNMRFNYAREEIYSINMCNMSKAESDCEKIIIEKDAPKGASLVAALKLFSLITPKQTSESSATQSQYQQAQQLEQTVRDVDGNEYHTVKIGTQVWMVENLKTTRYRNGDPIPNETNLNDWSSASKGVYCNYKNDETLAARYGRLYNWYVVCDSRNIAPPGWHVPNKDDWSTLINFLGGIKEARSKLIIADNSFYYLDATNSTGFTALPGGALVTKFKEFMNLRDAGKWWSSTEHDSIDANYLLLT